MVKWLLGGILLVILALISYTIIMTEWGRRILGNPEESSVDDDLPSRVLVGKNGAYWRDYGTHYSMCPVSDDNEPVEPKAIYVRAKWSEFSRQYHDNFIEYSDNPDVKPTQNEPPNCVYPRWEATDKIWICCHGGINCGGCSAYPQNCIERRERHDNADDK